jgi:hypothetical protein
LKNTKHHQAYPFLIQNFHSFWAKQSSEPKVNFADLPARY